MAHRRGALTAVAPILLLTLASCGPGELDITLHAIRGIQNGRDGIRFWLKNEGDRAGLYNLCGAILERFQEGGWTSWDPDPESPGYCLSSGFRLDAGDLSPPEFRAYSATDCEPALVRVRYEVYAWDDQEVRAWLTSDPVERTCPSGG